jgi:hypothetical protein
MSSDKMSTHSHEPWNTNTSQQNLLSTNEKSIGQNLLTNKLKLPTKHLSTPSLGEISMDSDVMR